MVSQQTDPWVGVSNCNIVACGNEEWRQWTWPHVLTKSLLSAAKVRVSSWISSHKKHIYNFFWKYVNLPNLVTTEKTTPCWQGISKSRYYRC